MITIAMMIITAILIDNPFFVVVVVFVFFLFFLCVCVNQVFGIFFQSTSCIIVCN